MVKRDQQIENIRLSEKSSKKSDKETDCPYRLIPLGIAMHHLNDSGVMKDLYDGIRRECLKEIDKMIIMIESQSTDADINNK